jgi:hypothetical protein
MFISKGELIPQFRQQQRRKLYSLQLLFPLSVKICHHTVNGILAAALQSGVYPRTELTTAMLM